MFCGYCGFQLPDDADFCGKCGRRQQGRIQDRGATTELRSNATQDDAIEREVARLRAGTRNYALAETALGQPYVSGYTQTCESCGVRAPTRYVEFYQNIGAIILRFNKSIKGNLCRSCISKYFWEFTLTNLLLGWWGVISFFVTPFFILNNVVRYIGSLGMEAMPNSVISNRSASERITNFLKLFLGGVIVWVILIGLDFLLRANSYYLNPNANPFAGVTTSGAICLGAWFLIAAVVAFVIKR